MDPKHFDRIVRSLGERGSRRGVLALLGAVPLGGGTAALVDAAARGRHRRRTHAAKHRPGAGKRSGKKHKKPKKNGKKKGARRCRPEPTATTCAGRCGAVRNNCQVVIDCGPCSGPPGTACAAVVPFDPYPYGPGADCGGDLVCDCGQYEYSPTPYQIACLRPGVCRPNRAPVALPIDVRFPRPRYLPSDMDYPISLGAYEADYEIFLKFLIITMPLYGFLDFDASHPSAAYTNTPGIPGVPAPPVPAGVRWDCFPRCVSAGVPCEVDESSGPLDFVRCPDCTGWDCPEGNYHDPFPVYYIPFPATFTGVDSFTYVAIDPFGVEGPDAQVTITIYEV